MGGYTSIWLCEVYHLFVSMHLLIINGGVMTHHSTALFSTPPMLLGILPLGKKPCIKGDTIDYSLSLLSVRFAYCKRSKTGGRKEGLGSRLLKPRYKTIGYLLGPLKFHLCYSVFQSLCQWLPVFLDPCQSLLKLCSCFHGNRVPHKADVCSGTLHFLCLNCQFPQNVL